MNKYFCPSTSSQHSFTGNFACGYASLEQAGWPNVMGDKGSFRVLLDVR
jgi:hypothetical protein